MKMGMENMRDKNRVEGREDGIHMDDITLALETEIIIGF
jgi:hypothetical protein